MDIVDESIRRPNFQRPMIRQVHRGEESARIENRQLRILVKGEVPDFLLQANQAYLSGDRATALSLLGPENLELVREELTGPAHRVDLMYMLAKLFGDLREFDEAEYWCRQIVEHEPSAVAFSQLSHLLSHSLVNMSEGVAWARRAVELEPDNPVFLMQLGKGLFDTGRTHEGLSVLRRTAEQFPDDLD